MTTTKEKISAFFNKLGYWFTDGTSKGTGIGKVILLGLSIITPLFLIMAAPWLAWVALSPETRYLAQYDWLQEFAWIWPTCLFAIGFLSTIVYMIYNSTKDGKG